MLDAALEYVYKKKVIKWMCQIIHSMQEPIMEMRAQG